MKNIFLQIPGFKEFYLYLKKSIIYYLAKKKWNKLKKNKIIKLDIASNQKGKNGFVAIDYLSGDIEHDLTKPIPLENSTVDQIYTSHTLEHFKFNQIIFILRECKRLLKPGSNLKICVPNAKLYIESYIKGIKFENRKNWYEPALVDTNSKIDQLNYIAYLNGQHKYMFDDENLINILKKSGFEKVMLRDFEKDLDLEERHFESIYAVAIK